MRITFEGIMSWGIGASLVLATVLAVLFCCYAVWGSVTTDNNCRGLAYDGGDFNLGSPTCFHKQVTPLRTSR